MLDFDSDRGRPQTDLRVRAAGVEFGIKPYIALGPVMRFLDAPNPNSPTPQQDSLIAFRAFLEAAVVDEDTHKIDQLLADDNPQALLPREIQRLGIQILGLVADRPTEQQSGSSATSAAAGTKSTESLPSPVAA